MSLRVTEPVILFCLPLKFVLRREVSRGHFYRYSESNNRPITNVVIVSTHEKVSRQKHIELTNERLPSPWLFPSRHAPQRVVG